MSRFTDTYLLYLLAQASARASAGFHAQLATRGIPVATWRILATLYPDAPATIGNLAESCMTKQPTMTRQIDRLERAGLVARRSSGKDRRRVSVHLTEAGRNLAAELTDKARAHEADVLGGHSPAEIDQIKSLLSGLARI